MGIDNNVRSTFNSEAHDIVCAGDGCIRQVCLVGGPGEFAVGHYSNARSE